jgi:hypothetical protein
MKILLTLITCLWVCGNSFAQNLNKISGKILDENKEPVPFVVVKLFAVGDSVAVKSIASKMDGKFEFDGVKNGAYLVKFSIVGFKLKQTANFSLSATTDLGIISIEKLSKQLSDVNVTAIKPFIERQIDKTVLNIENSIVSSGSTALEILEKAPGVQVDKQNEQIKLNNKTGVTIMIDGKTSVLSAADITTMLANMNSDQISSIELISNPSAKYDAAGNAGIINIKLKRNKNFGTNGTVSVNGSQGLMPKAPDGLYRYTLNLNLNHRVKKWNIYGNAMQGRRTNYNTNLLHRTTAYNNLLSNFEQDFGRMNIGNGFQGKFGVDYYASDKTVIGIMLDEFAVRTNQNSTSSTYINENKAVAVSNSSVFQNGFSKSPFNNFALNFNIKHDFDKEGRGLTFDFDHSKFSNKKEESFYANYFDGDNIETKNTAIRNNTDANITVYAAKTDFTIPINKTLKLETGLKSSYVETTNEFLVENFNNTVWQKDVGKSNDFVYKENITALYGNISKQWKNWEAQVGLRAENTYSKGQSITDNKEVKRNYLSLFPTVFLNQKIDKNNNLRYSYSRRVDRPNYQQLNPFVFYLDPYTLDVGNPYLNAQYGNNFELAYSFKTYGVTFSYYDTKGLIAQISEQDDATRIISVTRRNLGRAQKFSADFYFPFKVAKFWNMQNNASVFYHKYNDNDIAGASFSQGQLAYSFNTSSTFILPKKFTLEINFWLNSPRVYGVEKTTIYQYALNFGLQKMLMDKKLKLKLNIDDLFLTNNWEGSMNYQNVNLNVVNRYTSRRINLSASYNFGNQNVKSARTRNTAADDIKSRAN